MNNTNIDPSPSFNSDLPLPGNSSCCPNYRLHTHFGCLLRILIIVLVVQIAVLLILLDSLGQ